MQVQTMIEQMLFTTVRITTKLPEIPDSPPVEGSGTGFLLAAERTDGGARTFLVTNKHVIEGAVEAVLHLIAATAAGNPALGSELQLTFTPEQFYGHPDPAIDIAMIRLDRELQQLQDAGTPIFYRALLLSMCATKAVLDEYEPIEPVMFIGYPNGLYDSASLLPIVRQGYAATAMNIDYGDTPTFLIDASVFPGSSGSPVFLVPRPAVPDKRGNIVIGGPAKPPVLLGIVAAVHQRIVPVIFATATSKVPVVQDLINLGIVYKASAISELARELVSTTT